jgi:hypothetical protein
MIHVTSVPAGPGNFTAFNGLQHGFTTQIGVPLTVSVDVEVTHGSSIFVGLFANDGGTLLMRGLLALIGMSATALWARKSRLRRGRRRAGLAT